MAIAAINDYDSVRVPVTAMGFESFHSLSLSITRSE